MSRLKILALVLAVAALLAVAAVACGSGKSTSEKAQDLINTGLQQMTDQNNDGAVATFQQVLKIDSQNKYAYYNLGVIDQGASRFGDAENNYRLALGIDPDFESALYNLAILRTAVGYPADAMTLYRKVIAIDDKNANAHLNLGLLLRDSGATEEGIAEITKAAALNPAYSSRLTPVAVPTKTVATPSATP